MKKFYIAAVLVVIVLLGSTVKWSHAVQDAPKTPNTAQQLVDRFWTQWEGARPSEAVHALSPDNGAWDQAGHAADDFQTNSGGKCLGHSEITHRNMGPNLEYICFLAHYNPLPVRVEMMLYRSTGPWTVIGFRIDGNTTKWMNEASSSLLGNPGDANNGAQN
ncbi:MAG TPA: hypothetical protein VIM11_07655 [Tepidisphaeraceae bacterium]|jgi:hypothetical protein